MKELDILLETFLEVNQDDLTQGHWPEFEALLDLEDDVLWDILRQPDEPGSQEFSSLIEAILQSQNARA